MINNPDQVTSDTNISANTTQATEAIDQSEKIEVELSNTYEDKIQPEVIEVDSQDTVVTKSEASQATDLQQYQLAKDREKKHIRPQQNMHMQT